MSTTRSGKTDFINAVDLCAGCGAASYGLECVGYNVRAAFEIDPSARYTYHTHIEEGDDMVLYPHDVTDVRPELVRRVDGGDDIELVFAGPPCQPFSESGQNDNADERRFVAYAVVDWIDALQPEVAVIELQPHESSSETNSVVASSPTHASLQPHESSSETSKGWA